MIGAILIGLLHGVVYVALTLLGIEGPYPAEVLA